jgi:hypothetical protein
MLEMHRVREYAAGFAAHSPADPVHFQHCIPQRRRICGRADFSAPAATPLRPVARLAQVAQHALRNRLRHVEHRAGRVRQRHLAPAARHAGVEQRSTWRKFGERAGGNAVLHRAGQYGVQ